MPGGAPPPRRDERAALRARALRMLALREHGRAELERKLSHARGTGQPPAPELLRRVLDELQAQGLLDEARFAQSVARRLAQRHGSLRVLGELKRQGLDDELARHALREAESELEPEADRALRLLRRHDPQPPVDAAQRARQMRFLQRRGFSAEAVREAMRVHAGGAQSSQSSLHDDCDD